ncbi:hypothetical protein MJN85_27635, partial [Salmonella enterica subsp. enterica serovar Anatum]|nr:hypothetical protein [Salmonella enterica subsp. enterica serovar Anatum]
MTSRRSRCAPTFLKREVNHFIPYESENFWFRGLGGGYYLWNDNADKLSIMAYWSPMYFKPGDS